MSLGLLAWIVAAVAVVVVQAGVTRRLLRSDLYTPSQQRLQLLFIWLVPIVGAAVVHAALRHEHGSGERELEEHEGVDDDDESYDTDDSHTLGGHHHGSPSHDD